LPFFITTSKAATYGASSGSSFTTLAISGSSTNWSNTSNASALDLSSASTASTLTSTGQYTNYLVATNFGFSIPTGQTVTGITVEINKGSISFNKTADYSVRLYKGGLVGTDQASGTSWPLISSYATYGGTSNMMGSTLTRSDVNATNFGIAIAARQTGAALGTTPYINHIRITITTTTTLPVELADFSAMNNDGKAQLSWSTASEINNDYFEIEKSADGLNFESWKTLSGNGTSNQYNYYGVEDENPFDGTNYYRLVQYDFDGTRTLHKTIFLEVRSYASKEKILLNTTNNSAQFSQLLENASYKIMVFNGVGMLVQEEVIQNDTSINLSGLSAGLYIVSLLKNSNEIVLSKSTIIH
jgi:hypothetical protein